MSILIFILIIFIFIFDLLIISKNIKEYRVLNRIVKYWENLKG